MNNEESFKSVVMNIIAAQEFVIDLDEQIALLREICKDIKAEEKRQLKDL